MHVRVFLTAALLSSFLTLAISPWLLAYTDRIAAIVNKEVITLSELKEEVRDEHIRMKARYSGEQLRQRMANKEFDVLNALIEERLQLQEAQAKGFTVTDDEVDQALVQSNPQGELDPAAEAELAKQIRKRMLLERIRAFEVQRIVTISDSEISQYYKEHQQQFMISRLYRLRQILFVANSEEERIHKQSQSRSVSRRLQTGESFRELALQYSAGPEAGDGGKLGLVHHSELLAPIAEALLSMKPGEMSTPIETTLGFHIIALDETIPQSPKPLEEVEAQIKARLFKERSEQVFQRWLADLKQKAFIQIKYSPLANS
ncbi:MAG: peptidylprolyl isomerase [Nitrospirales bacterium]|nr:MAG: peptidylprolyl isomerase [Nitrospirales bacterium]